VSLSAESSQKTPDHDKTGFSSRTSGSPEHLLAHSESQTHDLYWVPELPGVIAILPELCEVAPQRFCGYYCDAKKHAGCGPPIT
jgi:hypothetical protein